MKFAIVFCLIALATLAYSQPLTDTVNHRPSPPGHKPVKPTPSKHIKETAKPNGSKPAKEHAKPAAQKPEKEHTKPAATKEPAQLNHDEKPQKPETIINVVIEAVRPKPEVDYYNGKIVPTPKYTVN